MIKWIISDMDGTLLDNHGNLPADFQLVMEELKKRNIRFSPASGRQLGALRQHFAAYKDDLLFIAENGAVIAQKDDISVNESIKPYLVKKITGTANALSERGICAICCTPKKSYTVSINDAFRREIEKYFSDYEVISSFDAIAEPVIKISLCDVTGGDITKNGYPAISLYEKDVQIVISSDIWLDIMPHGINKGAAIRRFQEKWQIDPSECMAFGDYYNDKEMLQSVGESYAMENAQEEIKKIAKHIAPPNTKGGVTQVIREKVLHI